MSHLVPWNCFQHRQFRPLNVQAHVVHRRVVQRLQDRVQREALDLKPKSGWCNFLGRYLIDRISD